MKIQLAAVALATLPLVAGTAQATTLDAVAPFLVFGDSLSDPGNIPGVGQFTNGDTWASQLGADLDSGMNFAVGGATGDVNVFGGSEFGSQIQAFRDSAPSFDSGTSVVVWFGGNDLFPPLSTLPTVAAVTAVADAAITSIGAGIESLANDDGLRNFVVAGYPDLGAIPLTQPDPDPSFLPPGFLNANLASVLFNDLLEDEIDRLNAEVADVIVTYVDIFGAFTDILDDPLAFGVTEPDLLNVTCDQGDDCDGLLFWDDIHPTESIHTVIAELIAPELAPVPLPASVWMLLAAFGGLAYAGRRRGGVTA